MSDRPDDSQSLSGFFEFINTQLDLSALDSGARLSEHEIDTQIMPLIRDDIQRETLRILDGLMRSPQRDAQDERWRATLAPLHREVRETLAQSIGAMMEQRYPNSLSGDDWIETASLIITIAWLVRKQIDSDETPASDK
ncbi:MAG: hypothetical protein ABI835_02275 [Chloroflexota bacterium]